MFGLFVRAYVHACHVHHTAHACTNVLTLMDEQVLAHNTYNMLSTFKSPSNSHLRRINNFVIFHQRKMWVFLKSMYPLIASCPLVWIENYPVNGFYATLSRFI